MDSGQKHLALACIVGQNLQQINKNFWHYCLTKTRYCVTITGVVQQILLVVAVIFQQSSLQKHHIN